MNNNYKSARFGMQRSKDNMSNISTKSIAVFAQSLGVFAQSTNKLAQSLDVFS
jgi:hypothetical protein